MVDSVPQVFDGNDLIPFAPPYPYCSLWSLPRIRSLVGAVPLPVQISNVQNIQTSKLVRYLLTTNYATALYVMLLLSLAFHGHILMHLFQAFVVLEMLLICSVPCPENRPVVDTNPDVLSFVASRADVWFLSGPSQVCFRHDTPDLQQDCNAPPL